MDEKPLPGASIRHLFTEGRALGTLLLWVPFFMGFGVLTVAVLWTPALLKLNGISPANTAFVVAFNGTGTIPKRWISRPEVDWPIKPPKLLEALAIALREQFCRIFPCKSKGSAKVG